MIEKAKIRGRPRDVRATSALKSATVQLVHEIGYEKASISAISKSAGSPRQTLYNRWNSKAELVFETVIEQSVQFALEPISDNGTCRRAQLEYFLTKLFAQLSINGNTLSALIAMAQKDLTFQAVFRSKFVNPLETTVITFLNRSQEYGDLSPEHDPELLAAFILGSCWYQLLNGRPLEANLAAKISKEVFG